MMVVSRVYGSSFKPEPWSRVFSLKCFTLSTISSYILSISCSRHAGIHTVAQSSQQLSDFFARFFSFLTQFIWCANFLPFCPGVIRVCLVVVHSDNKITAPRKGLLLSQQLVAEASKKTVEISTNLRWFLKIALNFLWRAQIHGFSVNFSKRTVLVSLLYPLCAL